MTPPRLPDAHSATPADPDAEYAAIVDEIAQVQGIVNVADARLVELAGRAIALGVSGGDNLPPRKWVAWRAGVSPGRAADIVRLAERSR